MRLICKEDVMDILNKTEIPLTSSWYEYYQKVLPKVNELPTIEPKSGKWKLGNRRKFIDLAHAEEQYKVLGYLHRPYVNMTCSCCHMITIVDETIRYDFCPHCGAKMEVDDE